MKKELKDSPKKSEEQPKIEKININQEIEKRMKINKKWFWIPIVGVTGYAIRMDLFINKQILDEKNQNGKYLRKVRFYKGIFNLISFIITIVLLILLLTISKDGDWWKSPFFISNVSFSVLINSSPLIYKFFYKKGYQRYKSYIENIKKTEHEDPKNIKIKK